MRHKAKIRQLGLALSYNWSNIKENNFERYGCYVIYSQRSGNAPHMQSPLIKVRICRMRSKWPNMKTCQNMGYMFIDALATKCIFRLYWNNFP